MDRQEEEKHVAETPGDSVDERTKELEAAIRALKDEVAKVQKERDSAAELSGLTSEQARRATDAHITRLHRYNDIKDAGQILFGKLAELRGKTVKEMYKEYGVETSD
ncbi:swi5-like zinc finger protein [Coemansia sp. RSA 1722]|nr:swi5-like zinc finger protein [Coemansia sp. RSA 486]KAJ2238208.1 swi5-like zinc finger protein [Coemansia sp. RSA 485]KAJ2596878.1 swi5-like zinc finger protein [Coemansia sp. RSA 1722]